MLEIDLLFYLFGFFLLKAITFIIPQLSTVGWLCLPVAVNTCINGNGKSVLRVFKRFFSKATVLFSICFFSYIAEQRVDSFNIEQCNSRCQPSLQRNSHFPKKHREQFQFSFGLCCNFISALLRL